MMDVPFKDVVQGLMAGPEFEHQIRAQMALLRHDRLGVTELRVFDPFPLVAYVDSADVVALLCEQMDSKANGVYIGVQARPAHLFDLAPNRWVLARGGSEGNCARDSDIEWVTTLFFDIDAVSPMRQGGHPASNQELEETLQAAQWLARQNALAPSAAICCSGNGHYVLAPLVPISVGGEEAARKFRSFCQGLADSVAGQPAGVRIDPVYNLSRIMRVMGTLNRKGEPLPDRPHRRARFVTEPPSGRSSALHYMILNTEVPEVVQATRPLPNRLKCDLARLERCDFIQWCRRHANEVSEPLWWGLLTNLAYLAQGIPLAHEISRLDACRYDHADTQRVIERIVREGYKPVNCASLASPAMTRPGRSMFRCSRIRRCPARAPMYMAAIQAIQQE